MGDTLLDHLRPGEVICLENSTPIARPGVTTVRGSVAEPRLGLTEAAFARLAGRVDCVIHSAAITDFKADPERIEATNVAGTAHVLELARRARAKFYHISTAFVYPFSHTDEAFEFNNYEQSKRSAELLVKESGVPASIIRPSVVAGDSVTGDIQTYQGLHLILHLFLKGYLPVLPGQPDSLCDFVPRDIVARAILAIAREGKTGDEYWLTAGGSSITIGGIVDVSSIQLERITGQPMEDVRILKPDVFERLIRPVFLPALPGKRRKMIEKALYMSRYMNIQRPFPTSFPKLGINLPDPEVTLLRNIESWGRKNGYEVDGPLLQPVGRDGFLKKLG